jgi:hypothetical protein
MEKMLKSAFISALVVTTLVLLPVAGSSTGFGIEVSPAKLDITIPPGTTYNVPVTIHNTTVDSIHIQASLVDFGVAENGQYQFEKPGSRKYSLMRFGSINPREFDLPGGTTQQVRLTISIPPDTRLNGEYAGIAFFQTRPVRRAGTNFAFSARVASKVYATIGSDESPQGAVVKMDSARGSQGQVYRVLFQNTGKVHEYLNGQVIVQRGDETVDRIAMPDSMLVERGGQRLIEITGKALPSGTYQAIATIDYGGKTETGGAITVAAH